MDGKFYVIRGTGGAKSKWLTCEEEYDLEMRTWTEIQNMPPNANISDTHAIYGASHFMVVINYEFYVADFVIWR